MIKRKERKKFWKACFLRVASVKNFTPEMCGGFADDCVEELNRFDKEWEIEEEEGEEIEFIYVICRDGKAITSAWDVDKAIDAVMKLQDDPSNSGAKFSYHSLPMLTGSKAKPMDFSDFDRYARSGIEQPQPQEDKRP